MGGIKCFDPKHQPDNVFLVLPAAHRPAAAEDLYSEGFNSSRPIVRLLQSARSSAGTNERRRGSGGSFIKPLLRRQASPV